jgi:hypothetical protein
MFATGLIIDEPYTGQIRFDGSRRQTTLLKELYVGLDMNMHYYAYATAAFFYKLKTAEYSCCDNAFNKFFCQYRSLKLKPILGVVIDAELLHSPI